MSFTEFYASPSPTSGVNDENVNTRLVIMLHFQGAVNAGHAKWQINEDGEKELHMQNGEIFLLEATTITRVK